MLVFDWQLANWRANGGDLTLAFRCVNWTSVGLSGVIGTVIPGALKVGGVAFK